MILDFGTNDKIPFKVIKKGEFGGAYFSDICQRVNDKWFIDSWNKFDSNHKLIASNFYDAGINRYDVRCGTF